MVRLKKGSRFDDQAELPASHLQDRRYGMMGWEPHNP